MFEPYGDITHTVCILKYYQQKSAEIHESVILDPTDEKFKESAIYGSQKKLILLVKDFAKPFLKLSDQEYLQSDPVELNDFALSVYDFLVGGSSETKVGEQLASVMQSIKSTKWLAWRLRNFT